MYAKTGIKWWHTSVWFDICINISQIIQSCDVSEPYA